MTHECDIVGITDIAAEVRVEVVTNAGRPCVTHVIIVIGIVFSISTTILSLFYVVATALCQSNHFVSILLDSRLCCLFCTIFFFNLAIF
jgi:hypothetical protein